MNFSKNNKNPIIITGYGRSGTSFLALFFKNLGFFAGGSWGNGINGGMESSEGSQIFRDIKENKLTKEKILKNILNIKNEVTKNPRFLDLYELGMKTFQYWHEVYPQIKVILMQRDFKASILSNGKIKGNKIKNTENEIEKRRKNWEVFTKYLNENKVNFTVLIFPDFLKDYSSFYNKINELGIKFDEKEGKKVWDKMVDFNKVHF